MKLWNAVLAALQIFAAGTVLTDLLPAKWVGLFSLLVASAHAGTVYYMKPDQYIRPPRPAEEA